MTSFRISRRCCPRVLTPGLDKIARNSGTLEKSWNMALMYGIKALSAQIFAVVLVSLGNALKSIAAIAGTSDINLMEPARPFEFFPYEPVDRGPQGELGHALSIRIDFAFFAKMDLVQITRDKLV